MKKRVEEIRPYQKGDWVRFMSSNTLTIGCIQYFYIETGGYRYLVTDMGTVSIDSVLEHRPVTPCGGGE